MGKYHMVKKDLEITDKKAINKIIKEGRYSTLSLCRNNDPYIVTLSYGFDEQNNALYFHCAKKGLKLEFIKENPLVCGTIVDDRGYLFDQCDHKYRSLVFFGKIQIVYDLEEIKNAFHIMINHLEKNPDEVEARIFKRENKYNSAYILRLDITEIFGKRSNHP